MTSSRTPSASRSKHLTAFTLVELLVAISVLAVLMSLVLQLMGSATRLTSTSRQASDSDTEARYALNQIASDLVHRIRRQDVSAYVDKKAGNDRFFLFSETPGYAPNLDPALVGNISLVGYRVYEEPKRFVLQRYARALPMGNSAPGEKPMPYVLISQPPNPAPIPTTTLSGAFPTIASDDTSEDNFYQTIAENVVRMEVCLIKKSSVIAPDGDQVKAAAVMLSDDEIQPELDQYGFTRIQSIVITIAIMDPQNMVRTNTETVKTFFGSDTFDGKPSADGIKLPLETWNRELVSQSNKLARPILNGVRFYQRIINL